jgi:hypothetical protein
MSQKRDFLIVRPSRNADGMRMIDRDMAGYRYVYVQLAARYETLATRVTRRHHESPFRITTEAALDEYLTAREPENWPGETIIHTDDLQPEDVAAKIRGLL